MMFGGPSYRLGPVRDSGHGSDHRSDPGSRADPRPHPDPCRRFLRVQAARARIEAVTETKSRVNTALLQQFTAKKSRDVPALINN